MPHPAANSPGTAEQAAQRPTLADRRAATRSEIDADLWMVDEASEIVLHARTIDVSETGMRVRAPLGYGVRTGQEYLLCSRLPTQPIAVGQRAVVRRARVVRTRIVLDAARAVDVLEVGLKLAPQATAVGGAANIRASTPS